jgi:uncharacterized protein YaeQ
VDETLRLPSFPSLWQSGDDDGVLHWLEVKQVEAHQKELEH